HTCVVPLTSLIVAVSALMIVTPGYACSCGGVYGRTRWGMAERGAQTTAAIFEGAPERVTVDWNILNAKPGDVVRADASGSDPAAETWPQMRITFRVKKVYKGDLGETVELYTGMGGGDCGARFETGLDYLVYAYNRSPGKLWASRCSPGGW